MLAGQVIAVFPRTGTTGTAAYYYLFSDHLGSASTMTTTGGSVVEQARFLPFGEKRPFWKQAEQLDHGRAPSIDTPRIPRTIETIVGLDRRCLK